MSLLAACRTFVPGREYQILPGAGVRIPASCGNFAETKYLAIFVIIN